MLLYGHTQISSVGSCLWHVRVDCSILSPLLVQEIFSIIKEVNAQGITVLLVEQNAKMALKVANRAYVLETGKIKLSGDAQELLHNDEVRKAYLGA